MGFLFQLLASTFSLRAAFRTSFVDVFAYRLLPSPLRLQNVLDGIAGRTITSCVLGHHIRLRFHLSRRIRNRNRQAAVAHYWKIDQVVADKCRLGGRQLFLLKNFFETGELVPDPLVNIVRVSDLVPAARPFPKSAC